MSYSKMQEKVEIVTKHIILFWTKIPKNGYGTVNDFRQVPTMIVGKTFVTGVQRFCQLILMLSTYFRMKAYNMYRFN